MIAEKPWKLEPVMRLAIGMFASISVGVLLIQVFSLIWGADTPLVKRLAFLVGTLSFHGAAFLFIYLFLREHGLTWRQLLDWRGLQKVRLWIWCVATIAIVFPIVWAINQVTTSFLKKLHFPTELQSSVQLLQETHEVFQLIYFGLIAVVAAPIVEEILFRGILYPYVKRLGYPGTALITTSLLFAATHANLPAFLPLVVLAMFLVVLYELTDDLLAPILAHSLFNLINFVYVIRNDISPF